MYVGSFRPPPPGTSGLDFFVFVVACPPCMRPRLAEMYGPTTDLLSACPNSTLSLIGTVDSSRDRPRHFHRKSLATGSTWGFLQVR